MYGASDSRAVLLVGKTLWSIVENIRIAHDSNVFWHMARYKCWLLTYLLYLIVCISIVCEQHSVLLLSSTSERR